MADVNQVIDETCPASKFLEDFAVQNDFKSASIEAKWLAEIETPPSEPIPCTRVDFVVESSDSVCFYLSSLVVCPKCEFFNGAKETGDMMKEGQDGKVTMSTTDAATLRKVFRYLYVHELPVYENFEDMKSLVVAADYLQIQSLRVGLELLLLQRLELKETTLPDAMQIFLLCSQFHLDIYRPAMCRQIARIFAKAGAPEKVAALQTAVTKTTDKESAELLNKLVTGF